MNFFKELFSDTGSISMMRVLSLICVLSAVGIAMYSVYMDSDLDAVSILCGTFLGAGIGGKVIQRHIESSEVSDVK